MNGDYLMNTIVKLKKLTPNAIIPTYGTAQSAGADLYSGMEQPVTIEPGKTEFIHTGIAIAIPEGLVGLVYARSGMACKKGIAPANNSLLHFISTILPVNVFIHGTISDASYTSVINL